MAIVVLLGIRIDLLQLLVIYSQSLWQITPGVLTQAGWHGLINGLMATGLWDIGGRIGTTKTTAPQPPLIGNLENMNLLSTLTAEGIAAMITSLGALIAVIQGKRHA